MSLWCGRTMSDSSGHLRPNSKPSCGHLPTLDEEVFLRLEFEFGPKQPVAAQPTAWICADGKACAGNCETWPEQAAQGHFQHAAVVSCSCLTLRWGIAVSFGRLSCYWLRVQA